MATRTNLGNQQRDSSPVRFANASIRLRLHDLEAAETERIGLHCGKLNTTNSFIGIMVSRLILIIFAFALAASSRQGDNPRETQTLRVPRDRIPPSPALTPGPALESFHVPEGFRVEIAASENPEVVERLEQISTPIVRPRKNSDTAEPQIKPLTADQLARFEMGKELYMTTCGACHQPHGNGQEGLAPPLRDSEWALGSENRLIRVALSGVRGPITVKGKQYDMDMPPLSVLDDEQISTILTYIRREWGHTADPVEQTTVARIRSETEDREDAWTEKELLRIP